MINWRTNLGGAIAVTGTSLIGIGVLPQLSQLNPKTANILSAFQLDCLWWIAVTGFVLSCIGKGVTSLFAADAAAVNQKVAQVAQAIDKINALGSDPGSASVTEFVANPNMPPPAAITAAQAVSSVPPSTTPTK